MPAIRGAGPPKRRRDPEASRAARLDHAGSRNTSLVAHSPAPQVRRQRRPSGRMLRAGALAGFGRPRYADRANAAGDLPDDPLGDLYPDATP